MSERAISERGASLRHYFEDLEVGRVVELGSTRLTAEEIIAFATAFDPQPLHLDPEAARQTMVGQLCASGFHSCVVFMRLLCDGYLHEAASLGSPGIEEVRWLKPVLPGETLSGRFATLEKRPLASRPGIGVARIRFELVDGGGEVLMTWVTGQFMRMRAPAGE